MITVQPSRVRPQTRVATQSDKTPSLQSRTYPAPTGGWVSNANLAAQELSTAVILDNFWPTATGIQPRGGSKHRVSLSGAVSAVIEYQGGATPEFFACDAAGVYQFDDATADGTTLTPVVTGLTSGAFSFLEMQTDGGSFLTLVNGADTARQYDGAAWSSLSIGGVDSAKLSYVWAYNNRTYFIEKGTTNVWYLGVNSIGGTATKLPLAGVFSKGGSLLFGASWSSDSGDGMDDRCVFVTDRGEFAVFYGDPASLSSWSLAGVFDLGQPLGANAHMRVGGDLIVAIKDGLIPLSAAVQKDVGALKLSALSRAIDPDWRRAVLLAGGSDGWSVQKWAERNMALISPPSAQLDVPYCFVVNLETGAWSRFTGWDVSSMGLLSGVAHFGSSDGRVFQCESGGTDDGELVACRLCMAFDQLGGGAAFKTAHTVRGTFRHSAPFSARFSVAVNYRPVFPTAPNSVLASQSTGAQWDVSDWDVAEWASDTGDWQIAEKWEDVSGQGHALAVQLQVTSGAPYKLDLELVAVDLTYSLGEVVV